MTKKIIQARLVNALFKNDNVSALAAIEQLDKVNFVITLENPFRKITPLLLACKNSDSTVVKALLEKGASLDEMDSQGRHALHYAQENACLDVSKLLLEQDPSLCIKGENLGKTSLHEAARKNNLVFLEHIFNLFRFDLNIKDKDDKTLLHEACASGNQPIVKWLLDNGANPNVRDLANYAPVELAHLWPDIVALLQEAQFPSLFKLAALKMKTYFPDSAEKQIGEYVFKQANQQVTQYQNYQQEILHKEQLISQTREKAIEKFTSIIP